MRTQIIMLAVTLAVITPTLPGIAASPEKPGRSAILNDVTRCRTITDSTARLACFDKSVAALDVAEDKHEVVVVDQRQIGETRKKLFGVRLPNSPLFAGSAEVDHIDSAVETADVDGAGNWVFRLADGGTWRQTDGNPVAGKPRRGDKVVVRRGALGSFKLSVGGRPAVKVRREN